MILKAPRPDQRFLAQEVVQTSAMDCGPAALKSILEGFGISASYGRLREACQTDVDGTSIDTLEDLANQLGLQAEQVMLPADHLALPEAEALPAIVVVRLPNGLTHFLVVWGRVGGVLQVMDPATGRRWPSWKSFQNELYIHTFPVPVQAWREWAGSEGLLKPLRRKLLDLSLPEDSVEALIQGAIQDEGWRSLAALDAATRMVEALVRAHAFTTGKEAGSVLERFYLQNRAESPPPGDEELAQPRVADSGCLLVRTAHREHAGSPAPERRCPGAHPGQATRRRRAGCRGSLGSSRGAPISGPGSCPQRAGIPP